jgi:hypothetical protein
LCGERCCEAVREDTACCAGWGWLALYEQYVCMYVCWERGRDTAYDDVVEGVGWGGCGGCWGRVFGGDILEFDGGIGWTEEWHCVRKWR